MFPTTGSGAAAHLTYGGDSETIRCRYRRLPSGGRLTWCYRQLPTER